MRNLKRVLSLALALVMVLGMMVISTSAATFAEEEIENVEAVEVMNALGIVKGDGGKFYPDRVLTRAEAAKILAYATLGPEVENYLVDSDAKPFEDVPAGRWYTKYITYCKNLTLIHGVTDTEFQPNEKLTVVGFGKLLLGALGFDTTAYTGSNWVNAVKTDMEKVGLDIVTFDSKTEIDRDTACQMALIAMTYTTTSKAWKVVSKEDATEVIGTFETKLAAQIKVAEVNTATGLTGDASLVKIVEVEAEDYLLNEVYKVAVDDEDSDDFGRPGVSYTWTEGEDTVEMFYVNEALAKFEGPAAQKDIYAASGEKEEDSVTYAYYEDGVTDDSWSFTAAKADKAHADEFAAGTGYGVKAELYQIGTGDSATLRLVAVREYLGEVTNINDANPEIPTSKRSIDITVAGLSENNDSDGVVNLETEEYAEHDMVIVTVAGNKVQSIALAESIKGTATKSADGSGSRDNKFYTIGGETYVVSQNHDSVSVTMDGKDAEYYVDSMGNLIGNKDGGEPEPEEATYFYGYLLQYAKQAYEPAGAASLIGAGSEGQEAKEVVKFIDANGETQTLDAAVEVDEDDNTTFVAVGADDPDTDADESWAWSSSSKQILFQYALDEDGKICEIIPVAAASEGTTVTVDADNAMLDDPYFATDDTLFFYIVKKDVDENEEDDVHDWAVDKSAIYVGYTNAKEEVGAAVEYFVAGEDNDAKVVVLNVASLENIVYDVSNIYFANTTFTAEWDATAGDDGKGAVVYVYENLYVDGVKTTMTFDGDTHVLIQAEEGGAEAGAMYAYSTDPTVGFGSFTNLMDGEVGDVTTIQSNFFKAGSIVYVDADTVYVQIDSETKALTVVEALPAVDAEKYTITIVDVAGDTGASSADPATFVYFFVEEAEEA